MDQTYTIIPDFMLDYDLTMAETVALAVIHGFCQDGSSDFHGSYNYLARKCKCSRQWAIEIVASLVKKGYVSKKVEVNNGIKTCSLRSLVGSQESLPPVKKVYRGSQESLLGGSQESLPNNISIENIKDNKDIYIPFNFKKALMTLGVSEEHARDFMAVRKTKRAANTETAFRLIEKEIAKSGRSADECIRIAVEHSWQGFKAAWLPKETEQPKFVGSDIEGYIKAVYNGSLNR